MRLRRKSTDWNRLTSRVRRSPVLQTRWKSYQPFWPRIRICHLRSTWNTSIVPRKSWFWCQVKKRESSCKIENVVARPMCKYIRFTKNQGLHYFHSARKGWFEHNILSMWKRLKMPPGSPLLYNTYAWHDANMGPFWETHFHTRMQTFLRKDDFFSRNPRSACGMKLWFFSYMHVMMAFLMLYTGVKTG